MISDLGSLPRLRAITSASEMRATRQEKHTNYQHWCNPKADKSGLPNHRGHSGLFSQPREEPPQNWGAHGGRKSHRKTDRAYQQHAFPRFAKPASMEAYPHLRRPHQPGVGSVDPDAVRRQSPRQPAFAFEVYRKLAHAGRRGLAAGRGARARLLQSLAQQPVGRRRRRQRQPGYCPMARSSLASASRTLASARVRSSSACRRATCASRTSVAVATPAR